MNKKFRIIGICGSLRKESFNLKLLKFAKENMPVGADLEVIDISDLPHFNQDLEDNPPVSVLDFRKKVESADALLISIAEYNYSISSVLKNAIEWGSRPYMKGVLNGKTIGIMGASSGMIGTARAQYHFRQMMVQTDSHVLNKPEVMVTFVQDKFDKDGKLTDETTKEKIKALLEALIVEIE